MAKNDKGAAKQLGESQKPPVDPNKLHISHAVLSNCLAELIEEYVEWQKNQFIQIEGEPETKQRIMPSLAGFSRWLKQRGR